MRRRSRGLRLGPFPRRALAGQLRLQPRPVGRFLLRPGARLALRRGLPFHRYLFFFLPPRRNGPGIFRGLHRLARRHHHLLLIALVRVALFRLLQQQRRLAEAVAGVALRARRPRDLHGAARLVQAQRRMRVQRDGLGVGLHVAVSPALQ